MNKIKTLLLLASCALFLVGCASPATREGMKAQILNLQNKHPFSVKVQTEGGRKTNPLWTSEISSESFAQAVQESISESGLFRSVVTGSDGDYLLEVTIINVDKPLVGFDLTVNMAVNWTLTHISTKKVVFQNVIGKSFTATVGDAVVAIKRLRLAEEGAARKNIQEGLNSISQLKLQGNE